MPHNSWYRVVSVVAAVAAGLGCMALSPPGARADADGCAPGMASDFNGDGRSDTVIADPYATVSGLVQAGRILILYGDGDGLVGEGARAVIAQGVSSIGGIAETNDRFGTALAVADIDCDDYTDLVVGTPLEDINGQADSGYVQIIWGSAAGLGNGAASRNLTQTNFGELIVAGDQLGYSVDALEDVGQGGTPDPDAYAVAVGVPGGNVNGKNDAGWAGFLVAYDGENIELVAHQDTPGIAGTAEAGDRFGSAVSLNYLAGESGTVDAVVGTPNEDIGALADAGAITVIKDVYFDDFPSGGVGYDQDTAGVPGTAEAGDRFGATVDTVRVGATTRLAVGAPGEDIGSANGAGAVQLFNANAVTISVGASLSQDTAGVGGTAEAGDGFGSALALIGPGPGDPLTRLVVGVPGEEGSATNCGMIQVFPVTDLDAEIGYSQDTVGIQGVAESGDRFGSTVSAVAGFSERILVVGVADDGTNANGMVNVLSLSGAAPRYWAPGIGGIPAAGAVRFGGALATSGT